MVDETITVSRKKLPKTAKEWLKRSSKSYHILNLNKQVGYKFGGECNGY